MSASRRQPSGEHTATSGQISGTATQLSAPAGSRGSTRPGSSSPPYAAVAAVGNADQVELELGTLTGEKSTRRRGAIGRPISRGCAHFAKNPQKSARARSASSSGAAA